jgi:low affinity Fe/Cu permease
MKNKNSVFENLAKQATLFSGSTLAFIIALLVTLSWILTGPYFGFSDTWQLVINTGTTIVTFLMVFLIQRAQNKDSRAIHLKLNELVAALKGPSNRLIDVEKLTEDEIKALGNYYQTLAEMAKKDKKLSLSHSIEEAMDWHKVKYSNKPKEAIKH